MKIPKKHAEMPKLHIPTRLRIPTSYIRPVPKKDRKHHWYVVVYKSPAGLYSSLCKPQKDLMTCLEMTPAIHPETFIMQCRKNGRDVLIYRWKYYKHSYHWIKEIVWLHGGTDK